MMNSVLAGVKTTLSRRRILVRGIVQGVGFRPFVYGLATEHGLVGFVRNDGDGVTIEVEGTTPALENFLSDLTTQAPPLALIDTVTTASLPPAGEQAFSITPSQAACRNTLISPDVATCLDCLRELRDPADRRYHYPFINCTNCGPRFTIVKDVPYDRHQTTMRDFMLCPACRAEYEDPRNRRFHAQPNACPVCGPSLEFQLSSREAGTLSNLDAGEYALSQAILLLAKGQIVAVKGLGGYHLACDALNETAVANLRQRKHREAKPFALMVPDVETARQLCVVSPAEADLLQSRKRPIVLLPRRPDCLVAAEVAPHYNTLGLMLPYTPLHTLLLQEHSTFNRQQSTAIGQHNGQHSLPPTALVMTSGNISDEPIVYQDEVAVQTLGNIADAFLSHNRDIHMRCDDSVARIVGGDVQMLRRSRGYVPTPIRLDRPFPRQILAVGGHLKNTFCLAKGRQAFVSHHIGDLENLETLQSFTAGVAHFMRLFDIRPEIIAYDMHPEYLSTKWALDPPFSLGASGPPIPIQHHHAHIASVLAEHGLDGPVIGLSADGAGYGPDGAVWGGEVLVAGRAQYERVGHLLNVPLPGGDQAIRQPWRMAAVYLQATFGDDFLNLDIPFVQLLDRERWRPITQMIARNLNSPPTSSLGRLFDAVSSLLLGRQDVDYEGQAAIELEMVATPTNEAYPFALVGGPPLQMDMRPALQAMVQDIQQGTLVPLIAGRFHRTLAEMLAAVCRDVRIQTGLATVALSGGVFQNRLLLTQLLSLLEKDGFQPYINRLAPPNDGGLSLGQAAVAAARPA